MRGVLLSVHGVLHVMPGVLRVLLWVLPSYRDDVEGRTHHDVREKRELG